MTYRCHFLKFAQILQTQTKDLSDMHWQSQKFASVHQVPIEDPRLPAIKVTCAMNLYFYKTGGRKKTIICIKTYDTFNH